ncbi:30S ribosome-binding factor RbfA [Chroococcus sp. FPU101]|uniref:30S ribosome-binding factor RbfA n=1 Tax=Chroococcus sp. FPU101 TaxID=1974212 RepID=UPI001A8CD3E2|nr:30S ribosome-binding factor RbfA [Chroococcus sp. FPU101]GFE70665.1 ribosome-binding factor A [Chroococcus sp. FPU101]
MADRRRVSRIASMIKREVSQLLMNEIKDDRVGAGMVSVTDVDVSGDLQHAKIFVSIYGTPEAKAETMQGLKASTGFVRRELSQRIRLRRSPEIIFLEDTSIERGDRMLNLLKSIEVKPSEDEDEEEYDDFDDSEELK